MSMKHSELILGGGMFVHVHAQIFLIDVSTHCIDLVCFFNGSVSLVGSASTTFLELLLTVSVFQ